VGNIEQGDFESIVNSGLMKGSVNILTGVHGFQNGEMVPAPNFYSEDVQAFGQYPGVTVYNLPQMSPSQINGILTGPGTMIGGFCNSSACLAPFR
jgi:hypothetical protein